MSQKLHLHEEILLLALRDKRGTVANGTWYSQALGGALLAELILDGRVEVEKGGKKQFARLVGRKPAGDEVLQACLEKMSSAKRRATLETWVERFANLPRLKNRVAQGLCRKKILRADEKKVLLIFTRKIFPEINAKPETEIIERLRRAIFTSTREVDARTVVLLALAHSTDVLSVVFDKKKLKERKKRIEQLSSGALMGNATRKAVEAAQVAVAVATLMPVMMMSTINN